VGHRNAEVLVGIHWSIVDANFVVKVRSGASAAEADVADHFAAMHVLPGRDGKARKVSVASVNAVTVLEDNRASVATEKVCKLDRSVRRSNHRLAD